MERTDVAIVINTCPKYLYLLEAHFTLLRRYGASCKWPVYLATECWDNELLKALCKKHNVHLLNLESNQADFFESRIAAMELLPQSIEYVLPLQEDFLLERPGPDCLALEDALQQCMTNPNIASIRLMPCPGPKEPSQSCGIWKVLSSLDQLFSYQATLWRKSIYKDYMQRLVSYSKEVYPDLAESSEAWNTYAIKTNPAETHVGLTLLKYMYPKAIHLAWPRNSARANAVYECPWPYRPTAVVKGVLEPWAAEYIRREGLYLNKNVWL